MVLVTGSGNEYARIPFKNSSSFLRIGGVPVELMAPGTVCVIDAIKQWIDNNR